MLVTMLKFLALVDTSAAYCVPLMDIGYIMHTLHWYPDDGMLSPWILSGTKISFVSV